MKHLSASIALMLCCLVSLDAFAVSDPNFHNYPTITNISVSGPPVPGTTITLYATVQAQSGGRVAVKRVNPDFSETQIGGTVKFFSGSTQVGSVRVEGSNTSSTNTETYVDPVCVALGLGVPACTFRYFSSPSAQLSTAFAVPINSTGSLTFKAQFSGDDTHSEASASSVLPMSIPGGNMTIQPLYNIYGGADSQNVDVSIPATQTTGEFAYAWNAPGYGTVDLQGRINNGPWLTPLQVSATGNTGDHIPLGTKYTFRILPHGGSTVLAQISFTGVTAFPPWFQMMVPHVIVPIGQSTGTYTYQWNAPGYEFLDVRRRVNSGGWEAPTKIAKVGTSNGSIAVGTTYQFRFYPHGDTTHLLFTLTVTASH